MNRAISSPVAFLVVIILSLSVGVLLYVQKPADLRRAATEEGIDSLTDLKMAELSLKRYFSFLNEGRYDLALKYHGSGYDYILELNPIADPSYHEDLLKRACEFNGFDCLKIKNIVSEKVLADSEFKFTVQFENNNGSLYKKGEEFRCRVKKFGFVPVVFRVTTPLLR